MTVHSAGLLPWCRQDGAVRVFLVHMGGPYWTGKDAAAWSIPKGIHEAGQDPVTAARREFAEEVGVAAPDGDLVDLGTVRSGSKLIRAYAVEADPDLAFRSSNTFPLEWPPRSGRIQEFPEVDRAAWFTLDDARVRIVRSQLPLLDRLPPASGLDPA